MKPIFIPEDRDVLLLPTEDRLGTYTKRYTIRKYVVEQAVTEQFWSDRQVAEDVLKSGHDRNLERKGLTRVNDIILKPLDIGQRGPVSGMLPGPACSRFILTISRAIELETAAT